MAIALGRTLVKAYVRLAADMEVVRNLETAQILEEIAEQEKRNVDSIHARAHAAGVVASVAIDDAWLEQELKSEVAREIADNPYLLTPYRALQLSIISKERVFEILSMIATEQEDDAVRGPAEAIARETLSDISELRLRRRQVSRSEVNTVIEEANLDIPPVDMVSFNECGQAVRAVVRTMVGAIGDIWVNEMTDETKQVFKELLDDFQDCSTAPLKGEERSRIETRIVHENDNLVSALKSLLRELESAADLFLNHAENARSEDIVLAAQAKAEQYILQTGKIRDALNSHLLD